MDTSAAFSTPIPPGPKGTILMGNLPELGRDPLGFLSWMARDYGDLVALRFGPKPVVLVSHPNDVETVLVTQRRAFTKPWMIQTDGPQPGTAVPGSEDDVWQRPHLAQAAFGRAQLAAYGEVMVATAEQTLATWRDGETRDVLPEMMRLTLTIVGQTLFGVDLRDEADQMNAALTLVMDGFGARLEKLFLLPEWIPTSGNRRWRRGLRQLERIMAEVLLKQRTSGAATGTMMAMLAATESTAALIAPQRVRDEALTFLLAGHETVALALTWIWCLLAQHPAVEAKLLAEVDTVLGGRLPTAADRPRLTYAERVVLEGMRLYPPLWVMGRLAVENCELPPYRIKQGTIVLLSPWVTHRDGRFFQAPDAFDPDRWAHGLAKRLPRFAYFPFGGGTRGCIGSGFAMTETVLLLATIAQRYRLRLPPDQSVRPRASITLRPAGGLPMTLHRRCPVSTHEPSPPSAGTAPIAGTDRRS